MYDFSKGYNNFTIGSSKIHGKGIISKWFINSGSFISIAIIPCQGGDFIPKRNGEFVTTCFGRYLNHSYEPNAEVRFEGVSYKVFALRDILKGEEITVDYTKLEGEIDQPEDDWI